MKSLRKLMYLGLLCQFLACDRADCDYDLALNVIPVFYNLSGCTVEIKEDGTKKIIPIQPQAKKDLKAGKSYQANESLCVPTDHFSAKKGDVWEYGADGILRNRKKS